MTARDLAAHIRAKFAEESAPEWTAKDGLEFAVLAMLHELDKGPRVAGEVA